MKPGQRNWSRKELILVLSLYFKIPFGRLHARNPDVIQLSKLVNRTANSVAYKLVNFASLDSTLKARGIKGAYNVSKLDKEIWNEFNNNWDELPFESEKLFVKLKKTTLEKLHNIDEKELPKEGKTRRQIIQARVNQSLFRKYVLASYNNTCCITGINKPELLIAGHIKSWKDDEKSRLNIRNGIAINGLHDKAFEAGLITITPDFKIKISSVVKKQSRSKIIRDYFLRYEDKRIKLPSRFLPAEEFLLYHNSEKFIP